MRKTIMSLSLAAALASTNVMADVDTLNAVKAALPANMALSKDAADNLEAAAADSQELANAVAAIIAGLGNDTDAITAVVQAAINENPNIATSIASAAASRVPSQANTISDAAVAVVAADQQAAIRQAVETASENPTNNNDGGDTGPTVTVDNTGTPSVNNGNGSGDASPS